MRWAGRRRSSNVEDRRGVPVRGLAVGGGMGTLLLVLLLVFLGGDPAALLQQQPGVQQVQPNGQDDQLAEFVAVVLADTEDVWHALFRNQLGKPYREPELVLFTGRVQSACGLASAAVGPFYCPADEKVYIDLSFFDELRTRFGAPGDFAMAYVIAHEVGHHVQNQLGISDQVHEARGRLSETEYNQLSVRLELQADYLAGVWACPANEADPGSGRRRGGAAGGERDRRRPAAAAEPGVRGPGLVHARNISAARAVVPPRSGDGRSQQYGCAV